MKKKLRYKMFFCLCVFYLVSIASLSAFAQKRSFTVFFEGEDNELHVYKVNGTEPGKTLMIIGGIQGDEVAGFLAADRYADFSLKRKSYCCAQS